jgi:hypothetical protein
MNTVNGSIEGLIRQLARDFYHSLPTKDRYYRIFIPGSWDRDREILEATRE